MFIEIYRGKVFKTLRPVVDSWLAPLQDNKFQLDLVTDRLLTDLQKLVNGRDSDLFVLRKEKDIVGFLGLTTFINSIGYNKVANEHYWYVLPKHRGIGSIRMIKMAKQWAIEKECSHLMMNASNLAGDSHRQVCNLYERLGMSKMESTYIQRI